MSFSQYEFPNASYYNDDLRELIRLYKDLTAIYNNLQDEIQQVTDYINNFEADTNEKIKQEITIAMSLYTNRLIKVENLVAQLENSITPMQNNIAANAAAILALENKLNADVRKLQTQYNELVELFHEYKNSLDGYIDGKMTDVQNYLEEVVTKFDRLDVTNPVNGKFEDINVVLQDLFRVISQSYGITAIEYDLMGLTAGEYDRMRISALDYSTKGYLIFWELRQGLMRSPFTGKMTHYSNIIWMLADLHKCGLTAKQYEDLTITAQEYDAWMINAFNYDWFGRKMVLKRQGISAKNYDTLKLSAQAYDSKAITASRYDIYGNAIFTVQQIESCTCQSCNSDVLQPIGNINFI